MAENEQAATPRDTIRGQDPGAARDASTGPGETISAAVTGRREQDTRTLAQAIAGYCVASVARQPAHELDAVHIAFLVEAVQQSAVQEVVEGLAREWERRIEVQLRGPMAAYDFTAATAPNG